jgi:serine/threonine protein kinase
LSFLFSVSFFFQNSRGEVKLSDFGISKELDHTTAMSASAIGSYRYMSPERLLGDKYDASADVWSVGITLIELWNKKYPFSHVAETPIHLSGELQRFQLDKILPRNTPISSNMRQFLKSTLEIDHNLRARCLELTQSDWFIACGINGLEDAQEVISTLYRLEVSQSFFNRILTFEIDCCAVVEAS